MSPCFDKSDELSSPATQTAIIRSREQNASFITGRPDYHLRGFF